MGLFAGLVALLACPAAPRPDGGTPAPAPQADGGATEDGGLGRDGGDDDAGAPEGDGGPPLTRNRFVLTTSVSGNATTSLTFTNAVADAGDRCWVDAVGPCLVIDCSGGAPLLGASAGELQVVRDGGVVLSATPDDGGLYPTTNASGPRWSPGDELLVQAAGGTVPRFSARLVAPPRVAAVDMVARDGGLPLLVRSEDFVVHWLAVDAGVCVVVTQLAAPGGVLGARRLLCDFEGPRSMGVIPAAALGALEPHRPTAISVGGLAVEELSPGGYTVRLQLTTSTAWRADVVDTP